MNKYIAAFVSASDYEEFAAALSQAVKHIKKLPFDPPLHDESQDESDQLLVIGLNEAEQIMDMMNGQEQQLHDRAWWHK